MKLRNKKTGEIGVLLIYNDGRLSVVDAESHHPYVTKKAYTSLSELNEEWEDYEEPKDIWWLDNEGHVNHACGDVNDSFRKNRKIGNYFLSREEAELAVRKLEAWKRLKDAGFRFDHIRSIDGATMEHKDLDQYTIIAYADEDGCDQECLDLLFGGEE